MTQEYPAAPQAALAALLSGASIEVTPQAAAGISDFRTLLAPGTRVYIAAIDGTPREAIIATARRLTDQGFAPMPHIPARQFADEAALRDHLARLRHEAGVTGALVLAGGRARPEGMFESSLQILSTGAFDGFRQLHVAGHPEGSRDIDPDGGERQVMAALRWKQAFSARSDAEMAIVTQFGFDPAGFLAWQNRIAAAGIDLPVHAGVAGPTGLAALIKYALLCGVGPSVQMLRKRALQVTRLMRPVDPMEFLQPLALARLAGDRAPAAIHLYPFGGIAATAEWLRAAQI